MAAKTCKEFVNIFWAEHGRQPTFGEVWNAAKAAEALKTSHNKQSTPLPNCVSCGNDKCSMLAGVCSKWLPVK